MTSASTTVTATTAIFDATMVGNYITDGTTWKQILTYNSGSAGTIITVDSGPSWTAASISVGGALASLTKLNVLWVGGNKAFAVGSFTHTSTLTLSIGSSAPPTHLEGYSAARGDRGQATITLSGSSLTGIKLTNFGWEIENFIIDCATQTSSTGVDCNGEFWFTFSNITIKHFTTAGFLMGGGIGQAMDLEVGPGTASGGAVQVGVSGQSLTDCWVHDITGPGIVGAGTVAIVDNLVTNCSTYGISVPAGLVRGNTVDGSGTANILLNDSNNVDFNVRGNIISNSPIGIKYNTGGSVRASRNFDGNIFYNNTTDQSNYNNTAGINGVGAYTPTRDLLGASVTTNPYVSTGGNNWGLNSTSGGGAAIKARTGMPGTVSNSSTVTYADPGVAQHQDAGGGGGTTIKYTNLSRPQLTGGLQ